MQRDQCTVHAETDPKAAVQLFVADGVGDELGHPAGGVHAHAGRAEDEVDVAWIQLCARCVQQGEKRLVSTMELMSLCTAGGEPSPVRWS